MVKEIVNIQFLWPYAFILVPIPFIVSRYTSSLRWETISIRFPIINRIHYTYETEIHNNQKHKKISPIYILMWVLLITTLARPVLINKNISVNQSGYDIVLAVDLSASMQALDYSSHSRSLNRLDAVKEVVSNHFLKMRTGDRIALVVFAEDAFLYSPLTFNHSAIEKMLKYMHIGMAGDHTAIGNAIAISAKALESSTSKNKIVILLTDGVDNASSIDPIDAANIAKKLDIRIYTIGIGKNGLVPIPLNTGQVIMGQMPLDEDTLNKIANLTFGIYSRAQTLNELEKIYENINKLEKTSSVNETLYSYESIHHWPLAIFFLLTIFIIISRTNVRLFKATLSKP